MNAALERDILDRLQRLDEARLAEVFDFVDFLANRRCVKSFPKPSEAYPIAGGADEDDVFFGFEPFAHRGGCVTEDLVNRLREEQQV